MTSDSGTAVRPPGQAEQVPTDTTGNGRSLGRWAAAAVIGSLIIMIIAAVLRNHWMPPRLPMPSVGPPWDLANHVPTRYVVPAIWFAGALGGAGVIAGLVALRRGERIPVRTLIVTGLLALVAFTVLLPAGSDDSLDYAVYGHIVALGHSPYVMTPLQYRLRYHELRQGVPNGWDKDPSVYGPIATVEQLIAAKLGGASLARTIFWLKLVNAVIFAGVALAADRIFRADPAMRARAHLLWTADPLLLWNLIEAGHVDLVAAGVGVAGLLLADRWVTAPPLLRALVAGACVGAAAGIKADFALFMIALGWALRRNPRQLLVAAGGAVVVLAPGYAIFGLPAVKALASRAADATGYGFYGFYGPFLHHLGLRLSDSVPVAACLVLPVAWLTLTRLPAGLVGGQAVRAGLALSLTWLLFWPDQFAWYSVMIIVVLLFYPATRLDWLAIAWLTALTIADMPGRGLPPKDMHGQLLKDFQIQFLQHMAPLVMLVAAVTLVALCFNGRWRAPALVSVA
jgi:hypothetical protein